MKKTNLFVTAILVSVAGLVSSQASEKSFEIGKSQFKLNVPGGWQVAEELYGLPLAILGPEAEGSRPVISVVPTEMTGTKLDPKTFGADMKSYEKGRRQWLSGVKGKALEFFPYKNAKWGKSDVHQVGYRYEVDGTQFVENEFFVVCQDKLFYLKSLATAEQDKAYGATMQNSLRSFSCN